MLGQPFRTSLLVLFLPWASAHAELTSKVETPQTSVELVSQYEAAASGASQWIGIAFKPKAGWHVYWKNPGDSGLPPRADFSSTPGESTFGPLEFPTPDRIPYGKLVNFGYEGDVLYPAKWTAPSDLPVGGTVTVSANLKWLICKEECVPGRANLSLKLPVEAVERLQTISGTQTPAFKSALSSLAQSSDGKIRVEVASDGSQIEFAISPSEGKRFSKAQLRSVFFFPEGGLGIAADAKQVARLTNDGISLVVPRKESKPIGELRGLLKIGEGLSYQVAEVINPRLVPAIAPSAPVSPIEETSLGLMILFAFLGGIILNLMPCILPVLSIKVLGLANQSGSDRSSVQKHGVVFTLGILISFWILAAILLGVRASGQTLGWGFQLQNPIFVAALALLFFMMALNLFGVFEIGSRWMGAGSTLATREGYAGSFFTGVLTTIAATPCSAPFMGSALGFALTQSTFVATLILTVLALGLAFPYLVFSFLPSAAKILPRPGPWMKTLKEILAFPLLATVVWLVSVVGGQIGIEGIYQLLVLLTSVAVLSWLLGKTTLRPVTTRLKWISFILITAYVLSGLRALGEIRNEMRSDGSGKSPLIHEPWRAWSAEAQARSLAEGKTVLVNFTASWCVTCKVNEMVVFERKSVKKALESMEVSAFLADWTNGDPVITAELAKVGRNSVPVYLLYRPGNPNPKILPQILSVEGFLRELGKN